MPSLTEKKILPYKAEQIYKMVMDIEKYPEFLPWCKQAKIIEVISEKNLIADLLINFKNFFEKYRSDVKHGIDENGDYFVDVIAIEGPFKYLSNRWKFKDQLLPLSCSHMTASTTLPQNSMNSSITPCGVEEKGSTEEKLDNNKELTFFSCEIEFFIEFQFNSFILEKMLGGIFAKATEKMMLAFEERAKIVF